MRTATPQPLVLAAPAQFAYLLNHAAGMPQHAMECLVHCMHMHVHSVTCVPTITVTKADRHCIASKWHRGGGIPDRGPFHHTHGIKPLALGCAAVAQAIGCVMPAEEDSCQPPTLQGHIDNGHNCSRASSTSDQCCQTCRQSVLCVASLVLEDGPTLAVI